MGVTSCRFDSGPRHKQITLRTRNAPVAQWIVEHEDDNLDLSAAKLPADEPGLQFKLPEEEDLPLDISVADHHSGRPRK